ncbi:hypothetical protein T10_12137 [Trichinella papuae]|uniref:Uncharacterized protein n=1 Tax=Trichinella papuae TaxID=268474 RepID=A0A0V1LZ86_9BILA|nr:hypothetical protein T10_12137 [Trichinella papuae]
MNPGAWCTTRQRQQATTFLQKNIECRFSHESRCLVHHEAEATGYYIFTKKAEATTYYIFTKKIKCRFSHES